MRNRALVVLLLACAVACRKSSPGGKIAGIDASAPSPDASTPAPNPDDPDAAVAQDAAYDGGSAAADGGAVVDTGAAPDAATPPLTRMSPCRLLGVGQPTAMDLSPDGKLAVFGNRSGGVTIFSMSPFAALRTITAHSVLVGAVAFSRDSARVASGDNDGFVALWDAATGAGVWAATGLRGPIQALAFSSSGTLWALTPDGLVAMDASNGTHAAPTPGTSASTAAFFEDGATIALGQADGSFRLLRAADRSTLATVATAHPGGVTALRISADGARIASGGADGTVALWSPQGSLIRRIAKPGKPVTSVDLNADGLSAAQGCSGHPDAPTRCEAALARLRQVGDARGVVEHHAERALGRAHAVGLETEPVETFFDAARGQGDARRCSRARTAAGVCPSAARACTRSPRARRASAPRARGGRFW